MSSLDFTFEDDLNIGVDPDNYPDQANPAPVPTGNYSLRITKFGPQRNKSGDVVVYNNAAGKPAYPVYVIEQVEVMEPSELRGRKIGLYQTVSTKPQNRNGVPVTQMGDLLRALDQTVSAQGTRATIEAVEELIPTGTINVRLDWEANDFGFAKSKMEDLFGGRKYAELFVAEKSSANAVYKESKCVGMKNFPVMANGKHNHVWTSPGGNTIEARAKVVRYYPSLSTVTPRIG